MLPAIKLQIALALVAAVVFFTNLGVPRLWDEDEPRNAACAREMFERGDWVVPTFNYELRTQKPVLLYWLMMGSYWLFGVNEFGARFPSAVMAVGTTLVTFQLGRRLFNVRTGMLAGLMMATCLMFGVASRAATPDSCLIFFTSLSVLAYVQSFARQSSRFPPRRAGTVQGLATVLCRWVDFAMMYGAMALAVLAKGPIGIALPVATIGLFLLVVNRKPQDSSTSWIKRLCGLARDLGATTWSMRPLTLIVVAAVVAAPWYVLVGLRTDGEWTRGFFGTENLARFQSAMEGHSGPVVYYLGAILVGFFPWSIVLPAGVWFSVRGAFGRSALGRPMWLELPLTSGGRLSVPPHAAHLLLICWAGVWIGLFSLASTKLPSYVLPAYPALALMSAAFADRWLSEPGCVPRWLMQTAWGSLVAVGIALLIGLPLAAREFLPGEELIGLVGLIPLGGGVLAILMFQCRRHTYALAAVAGMAIVLSATVFGGVAVRVSRHQNSASLVEMAQRQSGREARFATFAHPESSVIYYASSRVERYDEPRAVARFISSVANAYVITNDDRWEELQQHLPRDVTVIARQPRFLKDGETLLVGRRLETAAVPEALHR